MPGGRSFNLVRRLMTPRGLPRQHPPQFLGRDVVVGGVRHRPAADQADHLRRLMLHAGALLDGERERPVLAHQDLDAPRPPGLPREFQEL